MNRFACWVVPGLLVSGAAFAHSDGSGHVHGLLAGLAHPISGLDHLLAMIAVGLFAGTLGGRARWLVPGAFVLAMTLGAFAGMLGIGSGAPVEQLVALSVLVLGLIIALATRPSLPWAMTLVATCAVFHGQAHGAQLPAAAESLAYTVGFVVSTGMLHWVGVRLSMVNAARSPRGMRVLRASGLAMAIAGMALLYLQA